MLDGLKSLDARSGHPSGEHNAMIISLLTLLFVALVVEGFIRVIRYFWNWLRRGRKLDSEKVYKARRAQKAAQTVAEKDLRDFEEKSAPEQVVTAGKTEADAINAYLDNMKFTWYQGVIIFFLGCIAGLFVEEVWMFITAGLTQSRVGVVWGPFSPLYGFGSLFLTIICYNLRRKHAKAWQIFLISAAIGGGLEQLTGWSMETLFNAQSWTYMYLPDHITQWVAWRFLFFWGVLGLVWTKVIMPPLLYRIGMPTTKRQVLFVTLVALYLTADLLMTLACFDRKTERDAGIAAQNSFEEWIDEHYTDEFIANRFQNLVIGEDL